MSAAPLPGSAGVFVALRLRPGEDLVAGLRQAVTGSQAAAIVTCVGSLARLRLRFAGQDAAAALTGPFEITSLVGTLDPRGQHLHLTIADPAGRVQGGHLMADGAVIHTTAEVVLLMLPGLAFSREDCAASGYRELVVRPTPPST